METESQLPDTKTEANASTATISEHLDRIDRDLADLVQALAQFGLERCTCCRKFFRTADPKALFNSRELVCYRCLPEWWARYRSQIGTDERDSIERELVYWLIREHDANIVRDPMKLAENPGKKSIIASCLECRGTGMLAGRACSRCYDGNIWVFIGMSCSASGS